MRYVLMHKKNPVLQMELDEATGLVVGLGLTFTVSKVQKP